MLKLNLYLKLIKLATMVSFTAAAVVAGVYYVSSFSPLYFAILLLLAGAPFWALVTFQIYTRPIPNPDDKYLKWADPFISSALWPLAALGVYLVLRHDDKQAQPPGGCRSQWIHRIRTFPNRRKSSRPLEFASQLA
jgi:hypothetical protein